MSDLSEFRPERKPGEQESANDNIVVSFDSSFTPFVQIPTWLLCHRRLSEGAKLTWMQLASYANHQTRRAHPSLRKMAKEREISVRTLSRHVFELSHEGALRSFSRYRDSDGKQTSNEYVLAWGKPFPREGVPGHQCHGPQDTGDMDTRTPVSSQELDPVEPDPNEVGQDKAAERPRDSQETEGETVGEDWNLSTDTPEPEDRGRKKKPPTPLEDLRPVPEMVARFKREWEITRCKPGMVNLLHYGGEGQMAGIMKNLLAYTEIERMRELIPQFFRMVEAGKIQMKSEYLIQVFMSVHAPVRKRTPVQEDVVAGIAKWGV